MPKPQRHHHHGRSFTDMSGASWNGLPLTLQVGDSTSMTPTPTGSMLVAWYNTGKMGNSGEVSVSWGGYQPLILPAPALANQPSVLVGDFQGNNLRIGNASYPGSTIPIWISAYGPGIPGAPTPAKLVANGATVTLTTLATAQGIGSATPMQLVMSNTRGQLAIAAIIGGPPDGSGNNCYVVALNATQNTGPGTPNPPPPGYYATTSSNFWSYAFNWGSSSIFVAAMSPNTTLGVNVTLRSL